MFERRQLVARGAAIVLMFASFGYAQASSSYFALALAADLRKSPVRLPMLLD